MFYVGQPALDYLTLTTFNPIYAGHLRTWAHGVAQKIDRDKRRMQYTGELCHCAEGTVYVGAGEQKGHPHYMAQCSGLLADDLFSISRKWIADGSVNITRIDAQVTTEYNRQQWRQAELFLLLRSEHPNRSVSMIESRSGPAGSKLATVYFGSRLSDRFVRIYEKLGLGEDVYLRFEVEYKGDRARAVARELGRGMQTRDLLAGEATRLGLPAMFALFPELQKATPTEPKVIKPAPATVKWLIEQVAPAFDRVLNDHNIDTTEVEELFRRLLDDVA